MKNAFYLVCLLLIQVAAKAQMKIGDNPTTINSASLLELETTNKGLVFPRVALTGLSSPSPLPAGLLTGTVVFNTASGVGSGVGLYLWNGTAWVAIGSGSNSTSWFLTGNAGTNSGTNFLGTTDNVSVRFKTNKIERMVIDSMGKVGIGTAAPAVSLNIVSTSAAQDMVYIQNLSPTGYSTVNMLSSTGPIAFSFGYANSGTPAYVSGKNFLNTTNKDFFITTNSSANKYPFFLQNSTGYIGIGTATPPNALSILATNPLYLSGVQATSTFTSDSILTIYNGVVKKTPYSSLPSGGSGGWSLTGNSGTTSSNFIGTLDNVGFRVRTNNIQRLLVDSLGNVAIGSTAFNATNRERLLVDYGTTTSHTVANFRGSIDGYLQVNVQNTNSGVNASSDFVATADDGTDSTFYVDMGINSSTFAPGVENWGNRHDAYLYSNSRNLLLGTQASPSDVIFLLGGGKIKENSAMRLSGPSGNVVIGKGESTDSPQGNIIRGPNGNGTNIPGGGLTLQGGAGTGTAVGGSLNLFAGTTAAGLQGDVNIQGQNVKAKPRKGGSFLILNDSTPGNELVKLLIKETGEVNWYLDKQQLFIRDGFFDAFGNGTLYKYDFMHIDGATGRIGFNILNGYSNGTPGGQTNLPLTSSVTLMGSIATKVRLLDGSNNYVIQQDDHIMIIDKTVNGNTDMILSPVATSMGREYIFKRNNTSAGAIIVKPAPGEKLNGIVNGKVTLGQDNSTLEVVCGTDSWWVTSEISVTQFAQVTTTSITASDKNIIEVNFTSVGQSIDINLPAAADHEDKLYTIKRNADGTVFSGNVLRIVPASGENLDQSTFASPYIMENDFESVTVRSNGTNWVILNDYNAKNAIRKVSTTSTISTSDQTLLIPSTSTIDLTLPDITTVPVGKIITVKRTAGAGTGIVTLLKSGVAVEGAASLTIDGTTLSTVTVQSDGLAWWVISKF